MAEVTTGEAAEAETGRPARRRSVPVSLDTHAFGQISGRPRASARRRQGRLGAEPRLPGPRRPESVSSGARGSPSAPRSWPATERRSPRARRRAAPRRWARPPRASPERSRRPAPSRTASWRGSASRPARPTGTSGLELAFNRRLAGQPGGQLVAVASRRRQPASGGRCSPSSEPVPGQAGAHDDRPRPPAGRGRRARRPVRRRGRARRPRRLGAGAGRDRLLGPAAAGLDLQGDHDDGGARGGRRQAHRPVPGRRPRPWSAGARSPTPTTRPAAAASSRRSPSRATASSPRSGPKIGSERLVGDGGALRLQLAPEPLRRRAPSGPWTRPQSTIPTSIPDDLELGVSAIGQGQVLATPLEMASVAQTIADGGVRSPRRIVTDRSCGRRPKPVRVTSEQVAATAARPDDRGGDQRHRARRPRCPASRWPARPAPPSWARRRSSPARNRLRARRPSRSSTPGSRPSRRQTTRSSPPRRWSSTPSGDGGTVAAPIVRQVLAAGLGIG